MSVQTVRDLHDLLTSQGFEVQRTRKGHYRYRSPDGRVYVGSSTPSDHRGMKNALAHLKRMGFDPHRRRR